MKDEQYATILKMFTHLSEQIQGLRQDMTAEFKKVRQEMATEFKNVREEMKAGDAAQAALSQEILNVVGEALGELQKETRQTKKLHGKRIRAIEGHLGLI